MSSETINYEVLVLFAALAAIIEVALTPVFTWRTYLKYAHGKGLKTPITILFSFGVCRNYGLDVFSMFLKTDQTSPVGLLLSALLLAGGASGVFTIFTKMGVRNPLETSQKADKEKALQEAKKNSIATEG